MRKLQDLCRDGRNSLAVNRQILVAYGLCSALAMRVSDLDKASIENISKLPDRGRPDGRSVYRIEIKPVHNKETGQKNTGMRIGFLLLRFLRARSEWVISL